MAKGDEAEEATTGEKEEENAVSKREEEVLQAEAATTTISRKARGVLGIAEGEGMMGVMGKQGKANSNSKSTSDDSAFSSEEEEQHNVMTMNEGSNATGSGNIPGSAKKSGGSLTAKYLQTLAALARANADNVFSSLDSNLGRHRETAGGSKGGKGFRGKMASNLKRFSKSHKSKETPCSSDKPFDASARLREEKPPQVDVDAAREGSGFYERVDYAPATFSSSCCYDDVSQGGASHRYLDLLGPGSIPTAHYPYSDLGSVAYSAATVRGNSSAYGTSLGEWQGVTLAPNANNECALGI